ncbi:phosphopantetheine-binding protein [Desulfovibrio sp. OttesenSCG-928-C06]|nr:phosphopantetheine-binding protein [Desulfovibrio sp. OttesenSCG-928-C06]
MDENKFLALFQDTLQRETPLNMDDILASLEEWDSLAAMASIALAEREFSKRLKLKELKQQKTVRDVYELFRA